MSLLGKLFGDANKRTIGRYQELVDRINAVKTSPSTSVLRERFSQGESLDDLLPEAFAAVREAATHTLKQRHYDVQLMGGIALHQGNIAEMRTGEGKTLVATLPAYLNALAGEGVHVVTVNDYLSRRDATWMGHVYNALGVSVGCINHDASYIYDPSHVKNENIETENFRVEHDFLRPVTRREAYAADITYGTNNEYGFDYLRDNMAYAESQMVQRGHAYAIVDEIDSILIDEARTPLIISAPDEDSGKLYQTFAKIVPRLSTDDYTVDEKLKAVSITEAGIEKVEKLLGITNIYEEGGTRYVHHLQQALKAEILFHKDKEYVVKNGEVIIVDEFTGRMMPGRRWSDGLHQAVEAKENVLVQKESRTFATITFQNYFRLYKKLSGMTGTAQTSAEEFHKVYKLDVISIPTNKPAIRSDSTDRIYKTEAGKFRAIATEVKERHAKGQPVLIGTVSIAKNEVLSSLLNNIGVPHNVLNAKNHEREAEFIAQAGKHGAVTVATNMAGRGVDIILGGNPPSVEDAQKTKEVGGLHVIGTERHEARRIDNQLRGRAGRQGDPGSSQFFVSAEDEVVRIFGGDRLKNLMDRLGLGEDEVIENSLVSRAIEQAQTKIEGHNFDTRKHVLEYDDVMNLHRTSMYALRNEALRSPSIKEQILEYLTDEEKEAHAKREQELGEKTMRELEKAVLLRVIDELWVDHLEQMEYLRDSVRLRAYGQRDPLVEYKIEGQKMFTQLEDAVRSQFASMILKVGIATKQPPKLPTIAPVEKTGRNDPCPCGSGLKWKKCGLISAKQHQE